MILEKHEYQVNQAFKNKVLVITGGTGSFGSTISVLEEENRKLRELIADAGQMKSENQHMTDILQKIRELLGEA